MPEVANLAAHIYSAVEIPIIKSVIPASGQYKSMPKYLSGDDNFQDEFHVFPINWEEDLIEFMVDDEVFHTIPPRASAVPMPVQQKLFLYHESSCRRQFPCNPDATMLSRRT